MYEQGIADRYAKALLAVAPSQYMLDRYTNELDSIIDLHESDPALLMFISHPKVEGAKKKEVVRRALGRHLSPHVLSFILLMIDKNRGSLLIYVARRFSQLADEVRGVEKGTLLTAVQIPDDLFHKLQEGIQKHSKHEIILERRVDPSIVGGAIVKLGNLVIDGSVRHKLQRFRETMLKVAVPGPQI